MSEVVWERYKDNDTKHEFTAAKGSQDPETVTVLKKDAVDEVGNPLPAKPHLTPKQAEEKKKEEKESR